MRGVRLGIRCISASMPFLPSDGLSGMSIAHWPEQQREKVEKYLVAHNPPYSYIVKNPLCVRHIPRMQDL